MENMGLWEKLTPWKDHDKGFELEVSKKAENYYSVLKVDNEVILTIISPPSSFDIDTSVGGQGEGSAVTGSIGAGFNVNRNKKAEYQKPIILFKRENKAGLDIDTALASFNTKISEDDNQEKFKVDLESLSKKENVLDIKDEKTVSVDSTIVEISENKVILRPNLIISKDTKESLELLLDSTMMFLGFDTKEGTFRSNIMLYNPKKNNLKIVASSNMQGDKDENFELDLDKGGAGKAFTDGRIKIVDLELENHEDYKVEKKQVWDEMKSIISVPIIDDNENIIGVLNIDSDLGYQIAGFDNDLKKKLRMQVRVISKILDGNYSKTIEQ